MGIVFAAFCQSFVSFGSFWQFCYDFDSFSGFSKSKGKAERSKTTGISRFPVDICFFCAAMLFEYKSELYTVTLRLSDSCVLEVSVGRLQVLRL